MLTPTRMLLAAAALASSVQGSQIPLQRPLSTPDRHPVASAAPAIDDLIANTKPIVDSQMLQDSIKVKNLMSRAEKLYSLAQLSEVDFNHPTRVIGSKGHKATLQYIQDTLEGLGGYYKVSTQEFPVVSSNVYESRLVIGDFVAKSASPMGLSPPTKSRQPVYGRVTVAKNHGCNTGDYGENAKGSIVLIKRGACSFGSKSLLAGRAGAITAVVYNDQDGELNGSLSDVVDGQVATFGLSGEEGKLAVEKYKSSLTPLDGISYIDADRLTIPTTNIVAQTVDGDQNNCVMLGGHSDSVGAGPGINDDGSGSITVLEIAVQLAKFRVNNCVRLAWWSAEEEGLLGSNFYSSTLSQEENSKIRLFMDYDMLASPNFAYQIYNATNSENPAGSEQLRNLYIDFYKANGLNYTFIPFDGRSDYVGFIQAGIPAGGIATGAEGVKTEAEAKMFGGKAGAWYDPAYHQLEDDVGNVNTTAWDVNSRLVAHSVATYARSFKGFPERVQSAQTSSYGQDFKYRGGILIM